MTELPTSAPGFVAARPDQAAQIAPAPWEYQVPSGESQGSASFPPSFRALEAPLVRAGKGEAGRVSRPLPHTGIARSATGRATDVDDNKGAAFERP
jgi:hypothetical protein